MTVDLRSALQAFNKERKFGRKGPLCVALVITQHARKMGLPLDPDKLLTETDGPMIEVRRSDVAPLLPGRDWIDLGKPSFGIWPPGGE